MKKQSVDLTIGVHFGALAPMIHEQLGVPLAIMIGPQHRADEITGLHVESLLTDSEARRARTRLMKVISKAVDEATDTLEKVAVSGWQFYPARLPKPARKPAGRKS